MQLYSMLNVYLQKNALEVDEGKVMQGALSLKTKHIKEKMTPIKDVFMLSADARLDHSVCALIQCIFFWIVILYVFFWWLYICVHLT